MFVCNYNKLNKDNIIVVDKDIGEYLIGKGIPILSKDKHGNYIYAQSDKTIKLIEIYKKGDE